MDILLAHSPRAIPCSWPPSRHCSLLAAALQILHLVTLLAFSGSCISTPSVYPAVPQSALQLAQMSSAGEVAEDVLIKIIFL